MKYNVSVDKALARGKWLCIAMPMFFLLSPFAASFYIRSIIKQGWVLPVGFLAGFILSFICWGFTVTYWKIWAYSNVRNLHDLKKRAVTEKLIHNDGSFFNCFEIMSRRQRQVLNELSRRFAEPDVYSDDAAVPPATYFYISTYKIYEQVAIAIGCFAGAPFIYYNADQSKEKFVAAVVLLAGFLFVYYAIKMYRTKKPQLILDEEGIRVPEKGLMPWDEIYGDTIVQQHNESVFNCYYRGDKIEVELDKLSLKDKDLRHLIGVYKTRHAATVHYNHR